MKWTVNKGLKFNPENIFARAADFQKEPEVLVINENNVRVSMLLPVEQNLPQQVFIKIYKQRDRQDALKSFFIPSKAKSEWQAINIFLAKGIPVPRPLAFGELRKSGVLLSSCLIMEAVPDAVTLNEFNKKYCSGRLSREAILLKRKVIKILAGLISALHAKGVFYRDLHGGNILLTTGMQKTIKIIFVDLHKAKFYHALAQSKRIFDLAKFLQTSQPRKTDALRFILSYAENDRHFMAALKNNIRKIQTKAFKIEYRHLKSRTKRCVIKSSGFIINKTKNLQIFLRREYKREFDLIKDRIINNQNQADNILQESEKSKLYWLTVNSASPNNKICIKKDLSQGFLLPLKNLLRKSRAEKSWIASNGLSVRGIPTPHSIALIKHRRGRLNSEYYFICKYLPRAERLNNFVLDNFRVTLPDIRKDKDQFITMLARKIREIHDKGVYHADLKSDNILIEKQSKGSCEIFFVDLDRVSFYKKLSTKKIINNLSQINASVADCITLRDRIKFFMLYAKGSRLMSHRKKIYRRIVAIGKKKNTLPYGVSFETRKNTKLRSRQH